MPRPKLGPALKPLKKPGRPTVYVIRYYDDAGQRRMHSTGTGDPREAQKAFDAWREEGARKRAVGRGDPAQVLIRHVLINYSEEHGDDVAAAQTMAYAIQPMLWFFGRKTMDDLTPNLCKEYWEWRRCHSVKTVKTGDAETQILVERAIGDGTIIRELAGTLRPAIKHAISNKRLKPGAYSVPVPTAPPGRTYWITRSEAAALVWETRRDPRARHHLPLYALIAIYTGQRRGAILDLTWKQIDLVAGRIDFNPPGRRQTRKGRPIIPIPRGLLAALRRAQRRASSEHVIAYHGEQIADVKTGFNSAAARAGIPDCMSHTLRHTAGTWMAQRGVSMRDIGGWLGHSETRTTELYSHHHPDFMEKARKAFE